MNRSHFSSKVGVLRILRQRPAIADEVWSGTVQCMVRYVWGECYVCVTLRIGLLVEDKTSTIDLTSWVDGSLAAWVYCTVCRKGEGPIQRVLVWISSTWALAWTVGSSSLWYSTICTSITVVQAALVCPCCMIKFSTSADIIQGNDSADSQSDL